MAKSRSVNSFAAAASAADATNASQQFYTALTQQAQQAVSSIFNQTLTPIQYPQQGDFLWNFLNPNQVFNNGTYNYISANVSPGTVPGTAQLSPAGGFPNAYVQVIGKIAYSLSNSDLASVNAQVQKAASQAQSIVSDYQTTFGQISSQQMATAQAAVGSFAVQTLQDYVISYMLGYIWSGMQQKAQPPLTYQTMAGARNLRSLLPAAPSSANTVISDVSNYLSILQPVLAIQSSQQLGSWILAQLNGNTSTPTTQNGGMSTVDPTTGALLPVPTVAYGLGSASIASIQNDLANTSRVITVGMEVSSASSNQLEVSVEGQAGFTVGSWLQFTTSAGATYDMSKASGTSSDASVSMKWAGYSIVPISPLAWQQATNIGWFYGDPIAAAVQNASQNVSGFNFVQPLTPYNLSAFSSGGNFGYLTNLLIANYPTITITYSNANYEQFMQSWSENVSGNLSLFGAITLGSFSQGAYGSSVQQGSDNSTFSVSFGASPQVVSVPALLQQAFVIGGSVTNPGAATPGPSLVDALLA